MPHPVMRRRPPSVNPRLLLNVPISVLALVLTPRLLMFAPTLPPIRALGWRMWTIFFVRAIVTDPDPYQGNWLDVTFSRTLLTAVPSLSARKVPTTVLLIRMAIASTNGSSSPQYAVGVDMLSSV